MPHSLRRAFAAAAHRRGFSLPALVVIVALMGLAAAAAFWQFQQRSSNDGETEAILHEVNRDDFQLTVTERGEIESGAVTEIRSEVKSKNTAGLAILRLVEEGTPVEEGDFLVELDSSALKEELTQQQILVNTSHALVIEAQNIYETAVIAKQEYIEGTYIQERQTIEGEVFVAEENLSRAQEYFEYSKKLAAKGYVNELQLEADRFAVEKARKELEAAETKLTVLEQFTRTKMVKQLESDILISESKWEAEKNSHALELEKLAEAKDQVAKTVITAPREGIVTYAHDRESHRSEEFVVEEGAMIRERQTIIELPDSTSMRVAVTVNESLIQFVKKGMSAKIRPVGLGKTVLRGKVAGVNQYAEPSGWRKANVKEYKAYVAIDETVEGLRSGMTASVTIECLRADDVVQTPVQSIYAHGNDYYCLVFDRGDWQATRVDIGPTNDTFYVISGGLDVGQRVAMDPKRYLGEVDLPALTPKPTPADKKTPPVASAPKA